MTMALPKQVLETLAVIGRMEPVTRGTVDVVRQRKVSHHFEMLLERRLIHLHHVGDEAGRPKYFATSPEANSQ